MPEEHDFLGNGLRSPFGFFKDGQFAMSSGEKLIHESIMIILGTSKGERVMRPDFGCGIQELVFAPNNTSTATLISFYIKDALLKWEPRIKVQNVKTLQDAEDRNKLNISIDYTVKTTNTRRNLVYPFYLEAKK